MPSEEDIAHATAKYLEYQQKLVLWDQYFEEDEGVLPSDADRKADPTYAQIASKVDHYKRLVSSLRVDGNTRASGGRRHGSPERRHSKSPVKHHHKKRKEKEALPMASPIPSGSGGSVGSSSSAASTLPPLPVPVGQLSTDPSWTALQSRATTAMGRCHKWERAFERQQGELPSPEVKLASATYLNFERQYLLAVTQLHTMLSVAATVIAHPSASSLHTAGTDNRPLQAIKTLKDAANNAPEISKKRRVGVMANESVGATTERPDELGSLQVWIAFFQPPTLDCPRWIAHVVSSAHAWMCGCPARPARMCGCAHNACAHVRHMHDHAPVGLHSPRTRRPRLTSCCFRRAPTCRFSPGYRSQSSRLSSTRCARVAPLR